MASQSNLKKSATVETTQHALSTLIILAQCFALMPITGVTQRDTTKLKFSWKSFRFVTCIIYLVLICINMGFFIAKIASSELRFNYIVTLLFFSCSLVTNLLFLKLAYIWPNIIETWTEVDMMMNLCYGFPQKLRKKLIMVSIVVISAAAIEYAFYMTYSIVNSPNYSMLTAKQIADVYFETNFSHVFIFVSYNFYIGLTVQMVNLFSTFSWSYMDLFIMLISTALSSRFIQINHRIIKLANTKVMDEQLWMDIRNDYNRLNLLCKMINKAITDLILLSFSNNLFVILVQLLNSLEPSHGGGIMERLYFVYSFGFIILRTAAVSIFASNIDTESKQPGYTLNTLPPEIYNDEIERLIIQIKMDPSALTGRGFFQVRKSLILSIAGAIVTYELIFIQFNIH